MSTKSALKAAKAALDSGNYDKAITDSQSVLASDGQNYFARLFLGRAYEKQGKLENAATSYNDAAKSRPDDSQAWQGLLSLYEAQGSANIDEYRKAAVKVAEIFGRAEDLHRCQTTIDQLISLTKRYGTKAQYKRALEVLLPGGPVYEYLEGRIPEPSNTYIRLAEITEQEEQQTVKQEIAARRTRIGAKLGQVTADVKREVFAQSDLERLYREIINWSSNDEIRREYEEKLLERLYDVLIYTDPLEKSKNLDDVLTLAEGMVIIHHPFQLAWDLVLESRDSDDLSELDSNILREYVTFFEDSGLGKVLEGWLNSELSPFPAASKDAETNGDAQQQLSPEDRLLLITEGLAAAEHSPLAHRLAADYYLHLEEHESAVETARAGLKTIVVESTKLGLSFQNTKDAINSDLATALVQYQSPRNHAEARRLFEDILSRKPKWSPAWIGLGLIFEEREEYGSAIDFLSKAQEQDRGNIYVGTELAWCRALNGSYGEAQSELQSYLPDLSADDPRGRDLRAQVLYRIGVCIWALDPSKSARKDRNGSYSWFLAAIKSNVNFAPAYTSLGLYYADYAKDRKRARQCFQKAFELSPAETDAAERLARSFAEQGDWDIVEVIAQRVIDTGRARPPPGSKRKGLSWPYSAIGVVQMNKQEYQLAITSFLAALRISPDDYQSYVGLGESYHNSGRYNSALRTFDYALETRNNKDLRMSGETWFARYMLANVHRELGDYDEAVSGLEEVLDSRPSEFGVMMSLVQTFVERSWRCVELGLYDKAVKSARDAVLTACEIAKERPHAFNLWKAVGDACLIFTWVQTGTKQFPSTEVLKLLSSGESDGHYISLSDLDDISLDSIKDAIEPSPILSGIMCFKRAIHCSSHDIHAQAVAWYNLGSAQHRAYISVQSKAGRKHLKAAVRCFKRAIELEAGNAEFWSALGVVTTLLNPKVAQHSFVRSLHLNELNAKVWTNLGVLYLSQNDHELAHEAFGRAQSTDPDYAHAWLGEGLIALLGGRTNEALSHFTHAFDISDSASLIPKSQYALSVFDHLLSAPAASNDLTSLIQPIFALEQLNRQKADDLPFQHLAALFFERVGNHIDAIESLTTLCIAAETEYEASESLASLARYAHAKSDLARNQLAARQFETATENAETALDLSADIDNSGLDASSRTRLRLSAHLTAGLALHYQERNGEAIAMFKAALQESNSDPEVICSLVQILWAHGGEDEKQVAREQLFECVEKHSDHVGSVALLGAIAALDGDADTMSAVKDDLLIFRAKEGLNMSEVNDIENLLAAIAALLWNGHSEEGAGAEAQVGIVLRPDQPSGWNEMANLFGDAYSSKMALNTSQDAIPPYGTMDSGGLAKASAGVGTVGTAQQSILLAPWIEEGWNSLDSSIA